MGAETPAAVAPDNRVVIGVAFGNSNSSIAHTVDDKPEVIANEDGDRQIPSVLSYVDGDEYYGQQAKNFLIRNPQNTIAYFRDFLGQEFKSIDPTHNHASAHPQDHNGSVSFTVKDRTGDGDAPSTLSATEIATRYLGRLVGSASEYLGKTVTSAVIAVPTNFGEAQRVALTEAANAAGLEVLQLISEPAASVLAYDARLERPATDRVVVVAELGGTRSDVAVVASRSGMYTILATAHDYEFTGAALDKVLINHFAKEFMKRHKVDPRENARSLAKLRTEAEATKKALSLGTNASFSVESLADGVDFQSTINRLRYETLARTVLEGYNRLIEGVVRKAGLDVLNVDQVVLSGGTAHTPRVAANLKSIFPDHTTILAPSTMVNAINPSELQARGAALQASLIQDYEQCDIDQSTHAALTTVAHVSHAIGAVSLGPDGEEIFAPIIAPETAVPARRTVLFPAPAGGDFLVRIAEATSSIKATMPEPKPKADGDNKKQVTVEDAANSDADNSDDDDDDELEETREVVWKVGKVLAEAGVRNVTKGALVEVCLTVGADLKVIVMAREERASAGVRGIIG